MKANRQLEKILALLCCLVFSLTASQSPPLDADITDANIEKKEESTYCFSPLHHFSVGPEVYWLKRSRDGGTKQSGWMGGAHFNYQRLGRYKWYWGIDAGYAKGTLKGRTGNDEKLKSAFTDQHIEGRFGYSLQGKCNFIPSFTPFIGFGYFQDTNKFHAPSPMLLKFITTYRYFAFGFLASITPTDFLSLGLNFEGRAMIHARSKVTHDPDFDDASMIVGEKCNYRIEAPITWRCAERFTLALSPFYEYRQYGNRENHPFDFFDTKFRLYGATLFFSYILPN